MTASRYILAIGVLGLLPAIGSAQTIDWSGPPPPNQTTPSSPMALVFSGVGPWSIPNNPAQIQLVEIRFKYKPVANASFASVVANFNPGANPKAWDKTVTVMPGQGGWYDAHAVLIYQVRENGQWVQYELPTSGRTVLC